ncbi:YigZ family protein [Secundilactobacillus folii]|uniref:YigZ family protein n=1 Tax=Secundilactobacillus folii TaxID=2678357 RepID=A0A7X2XVH9_9LACO|nr:YigZ family protein [Secundilactobacillus folii]MTV82414.1 YigZ family protein [Secundilactobacillus folii]
MPENYLTIKTSGSHELDIKKSQFICHLQRVTTKEDADAFIETIRHQNTKANHNCFAYMIGEHNEIQRESDDGEPSGTAGVPILEVLKKMNLHNLVAVVTRYFGGIKLGAGGLIRAYSNATSRAIESVGLVKLVLQTSVTMTVSYSNFEKLGYFLEQQKIAIEDTAYTAQVKVEVAVDTPDLEALKNDVMNLLSGQTTFDVGTESYHEVDVPVYGES